MSALSFHQVSKRYGRALALSELSFEVPRGSVCALVGPNGAGKTTTMGVTAGLLRHDAGNVDILGAGAYAASQHAGRVSLMPQDSVPSPHVSIRSLLSYYAELQGLEPGRARQQADLWLERVNLADRGGSRFGQLSHGMRRRFSVAQALLGEPELILLDEPTSGLDPELVVQVRQLIASLRGKATLLISSHVLSELEDLCDYVIFMEAGRATHRGSMNDVTGRASSVRITLARAPDLTTLGAELPDHAFEWQNPCLTVRAPDGQPLEQTNQRCLTSLLGQGVGILELSPGSSLEHAYLNTRSAKR